MEKRLVLVIFLALPLTGCAIFEVQGLKNKVDVLEEKVAFIEDRMGEEEGAPYVPTAEAEKPGRQEPVVSMSNKEVQIALSNAGYYGGPIDGKLGPKSKKAIKEFQADNGLKVDGIAGSKTRRALIRYLTK